MFISWTFENKEVEVFEFEGKVLFNPYHVGECLELEKSSVRNYLSKMTTNQAILLKNSDVDIIDFRKLANRGENFLKTLMWIQVTLDN